VKTHEIRKRFTDHFVNAGHTEVPSASVILDDPNLLFVNAGMVQFVPFFLGQRTPPYATATSIQKCIRTPDIDEVGITTRHNTFFQMAGNFSFGDYFKRGAIELAWSLLTTPVADGGYGFDPQRLWATVFYDDDEAEKLWQEVAGLPPERIQRRGMADNYWSMGIPGPCGPCSEIYYDRGPDYGAEGGPEADENRYIEIWNLVFMQNERGEGTSKDDFEILGPLPRQNIDTGMGIERIACLLQGVDNVYETDLLRPVIDTVVRRAPRGYGQGRVDDDVRYRVIADHSRTAAIIIGDGVSPSNEGRGYVLRRLLRRVVRSAKLLGIDDPIVGDLMACVRDSTGPSYPELVSDFDRINRIAVAEETAFNRTLVSGSKLFDDAAAATKSSGKTVLAGAQAFALHDTYGFPIELTLEMAAEAGLSVDELGFRELMAEQRRRAKADAAARKHAHADLSAFRELVDAGPTEFTGFDELSSQARILGIFVDGKRVPVVAHHPRVHSETVPPERVEIVLDRTPLYAESGGQIADVGWLTGTGGSESAKAAVTDVQKIAKSLWVHRVNVESGEFVEGDAVVAAVDPTWRHGATQGHSGTHMVHAALRQVLGPNAVQAGSLNRPGYLRFDFNSQSALTEEQRNHVEQVANEAVQADYPVNTFLTGLEKAKAMGAMAMFGEQYPDEVRVVDIGGPFSLELCGGTHVRNSAQIGPITILGEASVGSGVRRVEAYVGLDSYRHLAKERALMAALASSLKVPSEEVPGRVATLVEKLKTAEKELERVRLAGAKAAAADAAAGAEQVGKVRLVARRMPSGMTAGDLRTLVGDIRGRLGSEPGVVVLIGDGVRAKDDDTDVSVPFVVAANAAAQDGGALANDLVGAVAAAVGGRGGGKADLAQGSGSNPGGIDAALAAVRAALSKG
jgi:alanyl-tRNA synthetase